MQAERLKLKMLVEQIKPHFIFNALLKVKSMYHTSVDAGDEALGVFSAYLRESIGMIDAGAIAFEKELDNVARYVDFCNMGRERPFRVVYDVDCTDFSVPAFSVQPFVENAVKYSKADEKDDGYIMISSYAEGADAVLRISDNGIGFDTSALTDGAHGIRNTCERFRLLLGAEPQIVSRAGQGTEITVRIRREGGDAT